MEVKYSNVQNPKKLWTKMVNNLVPKMKKIKNKCLNKRQLLKTPRCNLSAWLKPQRWLNCSKQGPRVQGMSSSTALIKGLEPKIGEWSPGPRQVLKNCSTEGPRAQHRGNGPQDQGMSSSTALLKCLGTNLQFLLNCLKQT